MKKWLMLLLLAALPAHATSRTVTLSVPGMNCAACPITIKKVLSKIEGVSQIDVSAETREAVVTYDDTRTSVQTLTTAAQNVGYPATVKHAAR